MSPKISIVVPVYNVSEYLKPCVDSLLQQSLKELEFIFVNDGSTDSSLQILNDYAARDERIKVLDQQNQGVSIARNNGIKLATSELICFVDADDIVEKDLYKKLFEIYVKHKPDVILFDIQTFGGKHSGKSQNPYPPFELMGENFVDNVIKPDLIGRENLFSPVNKLFKKQIIAENKIIFPPQNALSEDNLFNLAYFAYVKSFYYLDAVGYFYRETAGSATRNILKHDYFANQLKLYNLDYLSYFPSLNSKLITQLKSYRFIKNIISLVFVYFADRSGVSLPKRFAIVRRMVDSKEVKEATRISFDSINSESGRFDRSFLKAFRSRNLLLLYVLVQYTEIRSR